MKKKGFTLIELLAVIVILAIIAIIAVPVILNVIEKSKIGSAEQSAQGYIDAVEKQIVTNKVKNENLIEEGEYTKSQLDEKNVKIKGEITDAIVVVGAKGRVTQARFCINGYSIDYDGKKTTKNSEANYCNEMNSIVETCPYEENQVFNFDYTGDVQTFNAECSGNYKLEVWGAQGGINSNSSVHVPGKGGYSYGTINLLNSTTINVYVGGKGSTVSGTGTFLGGYNGGGSNTNTYGGAASSYNTTGGGATDMRIESESLYARVIVAGGGGGASNGSSSYSATGGSGGGVTGTTISESSFSLGSYSTSGTQTAGGNGGYWSGYSQGSSGSFGQGGNANTGSNGGAGGGGGWYGGGAGTWCSGGGGSGYIYTESTAANYPSGCLLNSSYYLTDASTIAGNQTFKAPNGSNETGHTGNGYARITYLGK